MYIAMHQLWAAPHEAVVRLAKWLGYAACLCRHIVCRNRMIEWTKRAMDRPVHPVLARLGSEPARRPPEPKPVAQLVVACPPCPRCGAELGWLVDVSRLECQACGHGWHGTRAEIEAAEGERRAVRRKARRLMPHEIEEVGDG